jgi:hypothetical protein
MQVQHKKGYGDGEHRVAEEDEAFKSERAVAEQLSFVSRIHGDSIGRAPRLSSCG